MRELVDSTPELDAAEADYERMGWEVIDRTPERAVVERGFRGSWLWHLLFFLLIPILANLCYSAYRRYNRPEQVVIRVRGVADTDDTHDTDGEGEDADTA